MTYRYQATLGSRTEPNGDAEVAISVCGGVECAPGLPGTLLGCIVADLKRQYDFNAYRVLMLTIAEVGRS